VAGHLRRMCGKGLPVAIVLDGSLTDWTAADRLDQPANGVAGYSVYARYESGTYYFALVAPVSIGANTTLWLNTDRNAATGFQVFGNSVGAEFNINFDAAGVPGLYTGADGATPVAGATVNSARSGDGLIVEFSVTAATLGGTDLLHLFTDINNTTFVPVTYAGPGYVVAAPVTVGTVTLDGSLADWTAADRIDGVAPVAGYEVYGRVSGDSYIFAMKSAVAIGPNTTFWLNTDLNSATGYQIFGNTGGAEFNVNFNSLANAILYTGAAGQTAVAGGDIVERLSADGTVVEFAIAKSLLNLAPGQPGISTLIDVNDTVFVPANYSGPQYEVTDTSGLPPRTDFSKKIAIVYSETTAARFFGGTLDVNQTAYSQLFMAAQNQAAMAGVPFDLLTEADLKDLSKLVNYDAIVFPAFQFVKAADVAAIGSNLSLLAQNYDTSLIAAGNFMTGDENGVALAGDPYARMKALFDLAPNGGGFPATVAITSAGSGFDGVGGYTAGEAIRTYTGAGYLNFVDATPGTTALTTIDNQTVNGATSAAVVTSGINGDRNVHFSTEALLGDNNQLWQAIQYAVGGSSEPTVGLQMGRQASIFAARNDMDQSSELESVDPPGNAPGIYDQLLPLLQQWKTAYNFVGSYYVNVGADAANGYGTNWAVSLPYYQQLLAMGNEIGSHSYTHLLALNPAENTNILTAGTGPGTFDYEFRQARDVIEAQIRTVVPGYTMTGAAVPGAPEYLATAQQIIQYHQYLSGGYAAVGAGYPGAFGYLTPAFDDTGQVYLAPNMSFDFTLIGFQNLTPAQALAAWQAEFASLTAHADVPVIVWPWHDYGATNWANGGYTQAMFTDFIATAAAAGAEFVTLEDLAARIRSFEQSSVTSSVTGNVITATVSSSDAGKFAVDVDNLGSQVIQSVSGWYAYDNDSVFTDRDGGTFTITLGASAADVTHITSLGARQELVSLTGDGTNLSFVINGEGRVVIDLAAPAGRTVAVTGATVVSQVGDILTLDIGANGSHSVAVTMSGANVAPVITSNGGGATAAISIAENVAAVTTVTATDANAGQTLSYSITGGADAALFTINAATGALSFIAAPNFEAPGDAGANNVYDVIVTVTDSAVPALTDSQAIAVTVTDVAETVAPVITSNGGGDTAALQLPENSRNVTVVTTQPSTDPLQYFISGGVDASLFEINATSGVLTFIAAPDFEAPSDQGGNNIYDVVVGVRLASNAALQDTQALAITVQDVGGLNYTCGPGGEVVNGTAEADVVNGNGGSDGLYGAGERDQLYGNGGADTIDGGAGSDTVDGGEGDDVVTYDADDAVSLGGAGVDTLLVVNQLAPLSFSLGDHQFERAQVVTDDLGASQWWRQVIDYHDGSWRRTNSDMYADDGRLVKTTFDVAVERAVSSWQFVSDFLNAAGTMINQDGKFDSGTSFTKSFDYAAGTSVDGISDELRELTNFFRNDEDRAAGRVYNVEGFYDDGRKFTQTNDIDSTQLWLFETNWYKSDGVTLDFKEIRWDDGTTSIVPY
jgi:serralysin